MQRRLEIVILGPEKTGKTLLISRLVGRPLAYTTHTGMEITKAKLEEMAIWYRDIAGDTAPTFTNSTINSKRTPVNQIYIVFDASKETGLDELQSYIQDLTFPEGAEIILIGTHAGNITSAVDNAAMAYAFRTKKDYFHISLQEDNHPTIQKLLDKSRSLMSAAPIATKRQSSDNGSVRSGESGVLPLSSAALHQHNIHWSTSNQRKSGTDLVSTKPRSLHVYETSYSPGQSGYRGSKMSMSPAPASCCSFALRMAGMAMILAALIGLIYIALAVVNIISAAALISLMNNIVVGVGSLLGASAATSLMTISQVGASLNVSTTAVAGMFMTVPSLALLVAGYGAFRAGSQKPAQNPESNPDYSLSKRR